MGDLDRFQLPATLHLMDTFGTTVLTPIKDDASSESIVGFAATLTAHEGGIPIQEDAEDLAALREYSKTALRTVDLDRLMTLRPVPRAYHEEPGWDDDAES